jgi:hypothetical protein
MKIRNENDLPSTKILLEDYCEINVVQLWKAIKLWLTIWYEQFQPSVMVNTLLSFQCLFKIGHYPKDPKLWPFKTIL